MDKVKLIQQYTGPGTPNSIAKLNALIAQANEMIKLINEFEVEKPGDVKKELPGETRKLPVTKIVERKSIQRNLG